MQNKCYIIKCKTAAREPMHFWHINLNRWMEEKMMKNGDEKLSKIENICRPMARVATVITIIVFVFVFDVVVVVSIVCLRTTATDIKCIQTKIVMAKEQGHTMNYIHIYFCSVFDSLVTDHFLWIKSRNGTRHQLKSNFINWSVPSVLGYFHDGRAGCRESFKNTSLSVPMILSNSFFQTKHLNTLSESFKEYEICVPS